MYSTLQMTVGVLIKDLSLIYGPKSLCNEYKLTYISGDHYRQFEKNCLPLKLFATKVAEMSSFSTIITFDDRILPLEHVNVTHNIVLGHTFNLASFVYFT